MQGQIKALTTLSVRTSPIALQVDCPFHLIIFGYKTNSNALECQVRTTKLKRFGVAQQGARAYNREQERQLQRRMFASYRVNCYSVRKQVGLLHVLNNVCNVS